MSDQLTPAELAKANTGVEPEAGVEPAPTPAPTPHPTIPENLSPKEMYFRQLSSIQSRSIEQSGVFKTYSVEDYDELKNAELRFGTKKIKPGAVFDEKGGITRIEGAGDNIMIADERVHFANRYIERNEAIKGQKGISKVRYLIVDYNVLQGIARGNITTRQVRTFMFVNKDGVFQLKMPKNLPVDTVYDEATESLAPNEARNYFDQIKDNGYSIY